VAGGAVSSKAEKCTVRDEHGILRNILCADILLYVALPALQASMFSLQRKPD
jgi:hypothetical protein